MKLKFYLIGLGTGIIVTAIIMGIALGFGGGEAQMTDEQVMSRAKELGMIESTVLMQQNTTGVEADGQNLVAGQTDPNAVPAGQELSAPVQQVETPESNPLVITGEDITGEDIPGEDAAGTGATADAGTDGTDGNGPGEGAGTAAQDSSQGEGAPQGGEGQGQQQGQQGQQQAAPQGQGTGAGTAASAAGETAAQAGTSGTDGGGAAATAASNDTQNQGVGGSIVVTIPDGMDSYAICEVLQTAGVIDSAAAFNTYLEQTGKDRYIGAGARLIPRGASYEEVSRIITGH